MLVLEDRDLAELLNLVEMGRRPDIDGFPATSLRRNHSLGRLNMQRNEPACAGSKHLQVFALSLVHERGELFEL